MCLSLNHNFKQPYNKRDIRWKLVFVSEGKYFAPYRETEYKKRNTIPKEEQRELRNTDNIGQFDVNNPYKNYGFHVFDAKKDALAFKSQNYRNDKSMRVVRVRVKGFLASGSFDYRAETYKQMEFI